MPLAIHWFRRDLRLRDNPALHAALECGAGQVLPLPTVLERLQREVPGQVLEVELEQERERWIYEIKLLTPAGQLTKVKLDARTAEVLRVRSRESREDQPRSRDNR